jgi:hypothetical protein
MARGKGKPFRRARGGAPARRGAPRAPPGARANSPRLGCSMPRSIPTASYRCIAVPSGDVRTRSREDTESSRGGRLLRFTELTEGRCENNAG